MSLQDMTDEAIVVSLLVEEIRRLDDNMRKERALKNEVIARYERTTTDRRELETRVALLEAELKRLKAAKPAVVWAEAVQIGKAP